MATRSRSTNLKQLKIFADANNIKSSFPENIAEVKPVYSTKVAPEDRARITGSKDAEKILRPAFEQDIEYREQFWALYTNRANRVLGAELISIGGVAGTVADPKIIFQGALMVNACGVILAHNHPSGNLSASQADIELTKKLTAGGKLLDITVLDHLILVHGNYFSFADEGML